MKHFCIILALVALSRAAPSESDGILSTALKFVKDCGDKSMVLCLKVSKNSITEKKCKIDSEFKSQNCNVNNKRKVPDIFIL
jgi:hypothetical protein